MSGSLDDPSRQVRYHAEYVSNVSSTDYPGVDPDNDHLWDLEEFKKRFSLSVTALSEVSVEFDLVGVDASLANAFRRILISEVPTMAIESVYIYDNTSVIQDEVLAQRLGLIPIQVDAEEFEYIDSNLPETGRNTDKNTLVFGLAVSCERIKRPRPGAKEPEELYINSSVYSKDLQWQAEGAQSTRPSLQARPPKAAVDNILIAKLRPGQRIHATLHAIKGRGEIHAKWSPVATASYRLLPRINILQPIPPRLIPKFQACFPAGVIGVRKSAKTGEDEAFVKDARKDTVSREVLRHPEFENLVELNRVRDFFLFKVETAGNTAPQNLFPLSVNVMRSKIQKLKSDIRTYVIPKLEGQEEDVTMAEG